MFGSVTFDWLPDWLRHAASNRFLNTDVWLHNAEYQARMRSSKYTPYLFATQSDTGVKAFRQWWSRHGFSTAPPNTFGPAAFESLKILDRSDQIDPWKNHSKQCASCRKALRVFQRIKGAGLASSIVSAIVFRRWPVLALFTVGLSLWIRHLSIQIASIIEGNPHPSGYADRSPAHQEQYNWWCVVVMLKWIQSHGRRYYSLTENEEYFAKLRLDPTTVKNSSSMLLRTYGRSFCLSLASRD
jgi:hypothetical protein